MRLVLENGLAALQADVNEVEVELLASEEQHMMELYSSINLNNAYWFYWRSMGLCYASPQFSQLTKVLTKLPSKERELCCAPPTLVRQGITPIRGIGWTV